MQARYQAAPRPVLTAVAYPWHGRGRYHAARSTRAGRPCLSAARSWPWAWLAFRCSASSKGRRSPRLRSSAPRRAFRAGSQQLRLVALAPKGPDFALALNLAALNLGISVGARRSAAGSSIVAEWPAWATSAPWWPPSRSASRRVQQRVHESLLRPPPTARVVRLDAAVAGRSIARSGLRRRGRRRRP